MDPTPPRRAAVPTTVEAEGVGRYPQEVEAAVYFCALEALNNVAKYANASRATVTLAHANGTLTLEVLDDGVGFDPAVTYPPGEDRWPCGDGTFVPLGRSVGRLALLGTSRGTERTEES